MGGESCCLDKERLRHEEDNIGRALGLSDDDVKKVKEYVDGLSGEKRRVSELLEAVWSDDCGRLTLEQRIYATFLLGVNLYGSLVREYILRVVGASGGASKAP